MFLHCPAAWRQQQGQGCWRLLLPNSSRMERCNPSGHPHVPLQVHLSSALGRAMSTSELHNGARSTPSPWAPSGCAPELRPAWGGSGRGHSTCRQHRGAEPQILGRAGLHLLRGHSPAAELELKFPHMVLVGLGERLCRPSRNRSPGGMCWCFFRGITRSFLSCFSLEKPFLSAGPGQDLWAV